MKVIAGIVKVTGRSIPDNKETAFGDEWDRFNQ
jgi:hypothetical protein